MEHNRFKSITAFLDMLWILLAGFGAMFIIAYLLIQPPAKQADVIKKAEYIIVLEWESTSSDDVDLWVKDPNNSTVSFQNKTAGLMNLEKDDLGRANDTITDEFGNSKVVELNREVITLRGVVAGEYEVMAHIYMRPFNQEKKEFLESASKLTVEIIKINPYEVVYIHKEEYFKRGQEISVVRFTVNDKGDFISYNNMPSNIIGSKRLHRGYPEGHIDSIAGESL